jgi:hypothetical protein
MKKIKTAIIAFLLLAGTVLTFSSCEEEQVLPSTISPSGDGIGMEDDGQFD